MTLYMPFLPSQHVKDPTYFYEDFSPTRPEHKEAEKAYI